MNINQLHLRSSKGVLTACLLLISLTAWSQRLEFKLDTVIETNMNLFPDRYKFALSIEDRYLYWVTNKMNFAQRGSRYDRYLTVYKLDLNARNYVFDTIRVFFKKSADTSYKPIGYMNQFASINSGYMIIACNNGQIRICKQKNQYRFEEVAAISSYRFHLTSFFPFGKNRFLGTSIYDFGTDDTADVKLVTYDLVKKRIEKIVLKTDYKGIAFTHTLSNFIDARNNTVAVANTLDYKVLIYDKELNLVDSITKDIPSWTPYNNSVDPRNYGRFKKNLADDIRKVDDSCSRIEKIYFLNDSTLLVSYRSPGPEEQNTRTLDVWQKKAQRWKNIVVDQRIRYHLNDSDLIYPENFRPRFTISPPLLFTDSTAIAVMVGNDVPEKPMLYVDYKNRLAKKYLNEEFKLKLFFYKWVIK